MYNKCTNKFIDHLCKMARRVLSADELLYPVKESDEESIAESDNLLDSNSEEEITTENSEIEDIFSSCSESEATDTLTTDNFIAKDGTKWFREPFAEACIRRHKPKKAAIDAVVLPPGKNIESPIDCFKLFIDEDVFKNIIDSSNDEGERLFGEKWKQIDVDEMAAFFGLLVAAGHMKSNNQNNRLFWDKLYGSTIFKATMGHTRFTQLLRVIRFDKKESRSIRRRTDKFASIRDIWDRVNSNFGKYYLPSANITVDEQLVPCRSRCPFIQYLPSKPDKYGIKIWWLCDSKTSYPLKGIPYVGKEGKEKAVGLAKNVVETLCTPYYGSNRNVTMDNYFTSIELAQSLLSKGLTLVGTLRKNKRCVPIEFLPNKSRVEGSTIFGFKKKITIASHVPKKGKAVIFMSTMHHTNSIITAENEKPISAINKYYNETKSAVDTLDQMVHEYMTKRKTNRWPFAFFMNLLDVVNISAFIIWCKMKPQWNKSKSNRRNLFLRELSEELVVAHIRKRSQEIKLQKEPREAINFAKNVIPSAKNPSTSSEVIEPQAKRRRFHLCPSALCRFQKQICEICKSNVCKEHSQIKIRCLKCKDI